MNSDQLESDQLGGDYLLKSDLISHFHNICIEQLNSLGIKTSPSSFHTIESLIILMHCEDKRTSSQASWCLETIFFGQTDPLDFELLFKVVAALRKIFDLLLNNRRLKGETFSVGVVQNSFVVCYKVLWHCAENMSYPEFYEAWHSPSPDASKLDEDGR